MSPRLMDGQAPAGQFWLWKASGGLTREKGQSLKVSSPGRLSHEMYGENINVLKPIRCSLLMPKFKEHPTTQQQQKHIY
jgi:hypothetical protein